MLLHGCRDSPKLMPIVSVYGVLHTAAAMYFIWQLSIDGLRWSSLRYQP